MKEWALPKKRIQRPAALNYPTSSDGRAVNLSLFKYETRPTFGFSGFLGMTDLELLVKAGKPWKRTYE
ncbi:MAG: hypothetical protein SH818_12295 [Saprospiraceae bacterium]|nr:hypothetical protein [Saprospiraceae bacterium]